MKKYLEDHPYMEPDGMQEGEVQDIDEKVVKRGKKYVYLSKKGKVLGRHDTKKAAEKQAKAIYISRNMGEGQDPAKRKVVIKIKKSTNETLEEKKWSKSERKNRKSKCDNPKGFTMKQFCKNQRSKSKKGERKNEQIELDERCQKGYKTHPKRKTKIMFGKRYRNCVKAKEGRIVEADPKKGTGKKPKGSGRRLYTDENPKDTVSVKFSSVSDIRDTLSKASFKAKSHKRQSQIINLIHQRVRAAYNNAKDPKVKARLKKAFDYAKKRKEASKKKTIRLRKAKK